MFSLPRLTLASCALALGLAAQPALAQEENFSPKQTDAVRKIVRDYLMEHPEVIGEAIESLREKMRAQAEVEARKTIDARKDEIFNGKNDPIVGNAKGDVILVEFFDYNCSYCKVTSDTVFEAVKNDSKVKLVLKDLPILSEDSAIAARVALAAKRQGKYDDVHRAFMKFRGRLDEKTIFRLAGEAGANVEQLRKDMMDPALEKQLRHNQDIARSIDVNSTPTFIVADKDGGGARVVAGAADSQTLRQLFDLARNGGRLKSQ